MARTHDPRNHPIRFRRIACATAPYFRACCKDLFRHRLRWARSKGADMVFGMGWERDGPSSRPLFEGFDFVPVQRFEDYYDDRTSCPDCRAWPDNDRQCCCEATLWALDGADLEADRL